MKPRFPSLPYSWTPATFSYFPLTYKSANIIPKPGKDHKFLDSNRPISIISVSGKFLEILLKIRICEERNIIL